VSDNYPCCGTFALSLRFTVAIHVEDSNGQPINGYQFAQPVTLTMFYDVGNLKEREEGLAGVPDRYVSECFIA
jgi:hypothetical protein